MINNQENVDFKTATIKLNIIINAPLARVWQAFADDMPKWWQKNFFAMSTSTEMVLDLRPGGTLMEKGEANTGILWYHVVRVDDFKAIDFAGYLFPQFGGPAQSYLTLEFVAEEEHTLLKVTDIEFGAYSKETPKFIEEGWTLIFAKAFKEYVENINID